MITRVRSLQIMFVSVVLVIGGGACAEGGAVSPNTLTEEGTTPTLRPVDGGPDYYAQFTNSLPTTPDFFPIALWAESVVDNTGWPTDAAVGANTYLQPTPNSDLDIMAEQGLHAITSWAPADAPSAAYFLGDEIDMWAGPGSAPWSGNDPGAGPVCLPEKSQCGYSVLDTETATVPPGRMSMANYGKGVAFWGSDTDAARFVNSQDVVSIDVYWFTDPNVCGVSEGGALIGSEKPLPTEQCRLAANYGRTLQRVRSLVEPAGSKPVWGFVEVGHPFIESDAPTITVAEIRAAVWSNLINGARGISYFVHNFAGDCVTQHAIRDCGPELRQGMTAINSQIRRLSPVLNAPFVDGLVSGTDNVDLATKAYDGSVYVLAGAAVSDPGTAEITVGCGASVAEVVDENRRIPISDGRFVDDFADANAVHVYRIDRSAECIPEWP